MKLFNTDDKSIENTDDRYIENTDDKSIESIDDKSIELGHVDFCQHRHGHFSDTSSGSFLYNVGTNLKERNYLRINEPT